MKPRYPTARLALTTTLALAWTGSAMAEELILSTSMPSTHFSVEHGLNPFVECVEQATNGEITFSVFPGGQIARDAESLNALSSGLAQKLQALRNRPPRTPARHDRAEFRAVVAAQDGFDTASPGIDVTVTDATGAPLTGEVGELAIRAPFLGMTASFWQDDARYLDSYWSAIPGLWVHGDLAVKTPEGGFVMMGRSDDTLKVAGKRLGPAEVEEVALELPEVSEAAAVGVANAAKGQKLILFLVPGVETDPSALARNAADAVGERLGKPFRPARVHVVGQLPKTRSGKIMRRLIRQAYAGEKLGDLSSLDNPAALDAIAALGGPDVRHRPDHRLPHPLCPLPAGGETFSPFTHPYWEEALLVEGELTVKATGHVLNAPAYVIRPPGTPHGPLRSGPSGLMIETQYFATRALSLGDYLDPNAPPEAG